MKSVFSTAPSHAIKASREHRVEDIEYGPGEHFYVRCVDGWEGASLDEAEKHGLKVSRAQKERAA